MNDETSTANLGVVASVRGSVVAITKGKLDFDP
jgi:hypothetical protein